MVLVKKGRLIKTLNQFIQTNNKENKKNQSCCLDLLGAWIFTADIILHRTTQQENLSLKSSVEPLQT